MMLEMEDRRLQSRLGECPWGLKSLIVAGRGRWLSLLLSELVGEGVVGEEEGEMGCMLRDCMGLGLMVLKRDCMVVDCMSLKQGYKSLAQGCMSLETGRMLVTQLEGCTTLKDGYPIAKVDYKKLKADHMSLSLKDYNFQKLESSKATATAMVMGKQPVLAAEVHMRSRIETEDKHCTPAAESAALRAYAGTAEEAPVVSQSSDSSFFLVSMLLKRMKD